MTPRRKLATLASVIAHAAAHEKLPAQEIAAPRRSSEELPRVPGLQRRVRRCSRDGRLKDPSARETEACYIRACKWILNTPLVFLADVLEALVRVRPWDKLGSMYFKPSQLGNRGSPS